MSSCPIKRKECVRRYYLKNIEKIKQWRLDNNEKVKEYNQSGNGKKSMKIGDWKHKGIITDDYNVNSMQ